MNKLGPLGGYLVMGSGALFGLAGGLAALGYQVGVGSADLGGIVVILALGLAALGSAAIGLGGPEPIRGRWLRGSLVMLALGLVAVTSSAAVAATMSHDPLESAPVVILMLVGGWTLLVGGVTTTVLLLRRRGAARAVGRLFVAGVILAIFAGLVANEVLPLAPGDIGALRGLMTLAAEAAAGVMVAAWAGLGVIVVRAPRVGLGGQA